MSYMSSSASNATPSADERVVIALRALASRLDETHAAIGRLVATVAEDQRVSEERPPTAADVVAAPETHRSSVSDVPEGLAPHLRSVETLLAS